MQQFHIITAIFNELKLWQNNIAHFADVRTKYRNGLLDGHGYIGIELFEKVIARNANAQASTQERIARRHNRAPEHLP